METYCLIVQYDGTEYSGFQIQPKQRTIQGEIEKALAKLAPHPIRIIGAGRTDAGVHSEGQTISFNDSHLTVPRERLPYALNALLPADIRVIESREVPQDFHARYDAVDKTYRYQIYEGDFPNVFWQRYAYWTKQPLDWVAMENCAQLFLGTLDFAGFASSGSSVKTTIRTMHNVKFDYTRSVKTIRFTADGFLYNMVRNLVGTLLDVGLGKCDQEYVQTILEKGDRRLAGATIAPQGLFLERVNYS